MGIKPPKGVILYGVPGTGKTLLAKAVANQTSATFLRVVGSELIQKYLGDGPKLVRELFRVAEEHAPSIVFIDEIDAIGTKRYTYTLLEVSYRSDVPRPGTTRRQVVNVKFNGPCWSSSTNLTDSTRGETSKSLWLRTESSPWTPP
jgi:ATP-dependent protease HslVU (ClpYQ) ATPase subunit